MATKGLLDQLGEYMVSRNQLEESLPEDLKVVSMEFAKADRIIHDAISQAFCVVAAITSTAKRVEEQGNKLPVISMRKEVPEQKEN
jgi:hypothetical protein